MLRDAEYFKSKIGGVDGAGDAGDYIVGLVKGKSVPKPKLPVTAVAPQEVSEKHSAITNGRTSTEVPTEAPPEVGEKGRGEEGQPPQVEEKVS